MTEREEMLALADALSAQELGSRAKAVAMLRRLAAPWRDLTWRERFETVLVWIISGAISTAMFIGVVILIGSAVDGISKHKSERNSCLQRATNGLEIEDCP